MRRDKVVVDINHGWSKAMLRLSAFTVPIWAIYCQITVLFAANLNFDSSLSLVYTCSLLLIGLVSVFVLANRISVEKGQMRFPPFPFASLKISPEEIRSIGLIGNNREQTYEKLSLTLNSSEAIPIDLCELTHGRMATLLRAIEKAHPNCAIEPGIESKSFSSQRPHIDPSGTKPVVIPYRSHAKLNDFRLVITAHEKYFWRVWLGFWSMTAIMSVPLYCFKVASDSSLLALRIYVYWRRAFQTIYETVYELGRGPVLTYYSAATTPMAKALLIVSALAGVFLLLYLLLQPNKLKIGPDGLRLRLEFISARFSEVFVPFETLKAVTLIKPHPASTEDSWFIGLVDRSGRLTQLKLSAFVCKEDGQVFLRCLELWAPHATIDPELITAITPTQKRSYTELWLQSLATPPRRNRLVTLSSGQSLQDGRYSILEQIGVGGQGVAYLATDLSAGTENIVLKEFVFPVYVDKKVRKQALQRFENEAQMLHNLDHPQIVRMKDYFVEDHRGYLVLEHIDGASLRLIMEETPPEQPYPQQWALDLALQMCSILEYLHGLTPSVVHRDFTPDNLILSSTGTLKLIDFNVAQQKESTKTGTVVGKHAYLPPEQFRGKPTIQSDIYAMGATIFFLLTGHDPEPLTVSVPGNDRSDVHSLFNEIVATCTQSDCSKRYQTVQEMKEDLLELSSQLSSKRLAPSGRTTIRLETREEELLERK